MLYTVYILECADGTLYTGCTNNLKRRLAEHNYSRTKGAKYTRNRRPVKMVWSQKYPTRGKALSREWEIKSLTREDKLRLVRRKYSR